MPFALMLVAIDALAYIVMEIVPEWMGSIQGQQARARVARSLNPDKRYRTLSDQLAIADTIANRVALADECLALGRFEEAMQHFDTVLGRPMGDEPA